MLSSSSENLKAGSDNNRKIAAVSMSDSAHMGTRKSELLHPMRNSLPLEDSKTISHPHNENGFSFSDTNYLKPIKSQILHQ